MSFEMGALLIFVVTTMVVYILLLSTIDRDSEPAMTLELDWEEEARRQLAEIVTRMEKEGRTRKPIPLDELPGAGKLK